MINVTKKPIEELKDIIYQQLLNDVKLYTELESLYEKKTQLIFLTYDEVRRFY